MNGPSAVVGIIKPTERPGSRSVERLIDLLPREVLVKQTHLDIRRGTREELEQALPGYESKIAEMVDAGAELIHPAGVPLLLLGYEGEKRLVDRWQKKYGRRIFTNGMSQVNALRAYGASRVIGASYFPGAINLEFARYLDEAGFEVLGIDGMDVPFEEVLQLEAQAVGRFIRRLFDQHPKADALYLVGSAWPTLDMIESLEEEFSVPVIQHIACQCWEIQKRLGFRRPVSGYGRLLAEFP